MAYDDGYYYGLAKLVALGTKESDDGKTVTVSNGTKTWTGTMTDLKCSFTVPGKDRYTVRMGSFSTVVDVSYGECIGVYMAEGYGFATQNELAAEKAALEEAMQALKEELETNFQDGVDSIYDAVVAKGTTPTSKSLSDVVDGINSMEVVKKDDLVGSWYHREKREHQEAGGASGEVGVVCSKCVVTMSGDYATHGVYIALSDGQRIQGNGTKTGKFKSWNQDGPNFPEGHATCDFRYTVKFYY